MGAMSFASVPAEARYSALLQSSRHVPSPFQPLVPQPQPVEPVLPPQPQPQPQPASSSGTPAHLSAHLCLEHRDKSLDVFCVQCQQPICTSCALYGKHHGHQCVPLEQAYKSCTVEMKNNLTQLEHKCAAIRAFLTELSGMRNQLSASGETCFEQVKNNVQFLKSQLDQKLTNLLKDIEETQNGKLAVLDQQAQSLNEDVNNFESLASMIQGVMSASTTPQYLKKHRVLCDQLVAACHTDIALQPEVDADLSLRLSVTTASKAIADLALAGSASTTAMRGVGTYTSDLDKNGIFYYLGTTATGASQFTSPVTSGLVQVTASEWGYSDHIERVCWQENPSSVFTAGKNGAWICLTLNGHKVKPVRYRIQHASDCPSHVLRNWMFEGSSDGSNWHTLSMHKNDISLEEREGSYASWEIAPASVKQAYSQFRLLITDHNSSHGYHLMIGSVEIWGMLMQD
eukprot:c52129_g1_i1.p1 GENE.c52129_g1_i1~~c52129_g1_i1.p1  ORF type:complete len:517 (-),score=65.97 c52129_g1_i1:38-1408(-)